MEERTGPNEAALYVDTDAAERGSKGPFLRVYTDPDGDERWGYCCGACDSFAVAVDPMGRAECGECHNVRKPEEWDATSG